MCLSHGPFPHPQTVTCFLIVCPTKLRPPAAVHSSDQDGRSDFLSFYPPTFLSGHLGAIRCSCSVTTYSLLKLFQISPSLRCTLYLTFFIHVCGDVIQASRSVSVLRLSAATFKPAVSTVGSDTDLCGSRCSGGSRPESVGAQEPHTGAALLIGPFRSVSLKQGLAQGNSWHKFMDTGRW